MLLRRLGPALAAAVATAAGTVVGLAGWRLRRVLRSVADYPAYWSRVSQSPGQVHYVALGDSLAVGIGASRPRRGYVGLLADRLARGTGRSARVTNLGVPGATVADVRRTQVPALAAVGEVDLVTVAVGANDVGAPGWRRSGPGSPRCAPRCRPARWSATCPTSRAEGGWRWLVRCPRRRGRCSPHTPRWCRSAWRRHSRHAVVALRRRPLPPGRRRLPPLRGRLSRGAPPVAVIPGASSGVHLVLVNPLF